MSFSQSSGKLIERYVTRRLEHGAQRLWQIRIVGVDEPLLTTPCHRFLTDRGWMQAREMRTGEKVHFIEENKVSHSEVVASKVSDQMAPVYNLYTSGEHNVVVDRMVAHNFVHFARLRTVFHNWFVDPAFDGLRPVTA